MVKGDGRGCRRSTEEKVLGKEEKTSRNEGIIMKNTMLHARRVRHLMCDRGRRETSPVGNPTFKCSNGYHPTECNARHGHGKIEEKHHII